jgi:RNA polymerase-binding protein DksA
MTRHAALAQALAARYTQLGGDIADIEADLMAPLDADFAEQANELEEQVALEAIEERKREEMAEIRAALKRIADGSYGACEVCGAEIPAARLKALPTAVRCIACASA